MSFGGAGQGNIRYSILLDDTAAVQKIGQFKTAINGITQPSQALATNIGILNTNFASIGTGLTKTNTGFTQTGVASKTLATNLTGVNTGFTTLGTGINGLATPTRTLTTNMGALGNNFKLLGASETQTVTQTNAFKTGITALTTPTQQVSTNMKSLVGNLGPLSSNFQKTTGAAKDMVVQENNLSKSSQSLGSRVKDNISKYSNLAIGLSTTITSGIGLVRSLRDVGDAHLAVDKAVKKQISAQSAYDKATTKVNQLVKEGKQGTVEYSAAIKDQSLKLQGLNIANTSAAIKQKTFNDSLIDTAINVVPAVLGTMGTLGSALNDAGVKGSLLNNTFGKMKAGATGLGSSIKGLPGTLKLMGVGALAAGSGLSGLASNAGPIAGLINNIRIAVDLLPKTFSLFTGDISTRIGIVKQWMDGLKNLSITGGLAEILDKLVGISPELDRVGKSMKNMGNDIKVIPPSMNAAATSSSALVNRIIVLRTQAEKGQITWNQYFDALAALKIPGDKFTAVMDEVNIRMKNNVPLTDAAAKSAHGFGVSSGEVDDALKKLGPGIIVVDKNTKDLNNALVAGFQTIQKNDPIVQGFGDTLDNLKKKFGALNTTVNTLKFPTPDVVKFGEALNNWGSGAVTTLNKDLPALAAHLAESEAAFKSLGKTMKADLEKAAADAQAAIDKMRGGVQSGLDKIIEAFHKVHKKGKLDFEVNFDKAKKGFDKFLAEVGDKLDHGGSANAQKYILAFEKKGTVGMSKSSARMFQPLFDWIEKHKDEPADVFMSGFLQMLATFDPKVSEQFKKLIDPSIGLAGEIGKKAGKEFSEELMAAINSTLKIADRFKDVGGHPGRGSLKDSDKVKIPTEWIPPETPPPAPKTPVKVPSTFIPPPAPPAPKTPVQVPSLFKTPPPIPPPKTPVQVPAVLKFGSKLNAGFSGGGGAGLSGGASGSIDLGIKLPVVVPAVLGFGPSQGGNLKPGVNEFTTGTSHGNNSPSDIQARMKKGKVGPAEGAQQGTQPGDDLAEFWTGQMTRHGNRSVPIIPNKPPTSNFFPASSGGGKGTGQQGAYGGPGKIQMSNAKPQINIEMALKQVDMIAKRILGLSAIMPTITLNNAKAFQMIDQIVIRMQSLSTIMPTITLNNAKAFQMIDQIVIRINALTGIIPKINVDNAPAVKKIDQIVKRIMDLTGINPKIPVDNAPAIKKVDQIAKRIQDLANIEPKININNTQAIKKVDQIAKRILDLPDGEVTIKVKTSGSTPAGTKFDSGGFKGDTSSLFVGGSKSDSGSGGGGGDTIINVHVMDETIMRRITARSGRGRFTMGA